MLYPSLGFEGFKEEAAGSELSGGYGEMGDWLSPVFRTTVEANAFVEFVAAVFVPVRVTMEAEGVEAVTVVAEGGKEDTAVFTNRLLVFVMHNFSFRRIVRL